MPKMRAIRKSVQKASVIPSRVLQRQSKPAVPIHPVLRLQQTAGNQAVGRLIQAKLKVGQPGDQYEQEADRVADQVMRMPEPDLRRQIEPEEEEEEALQPKSLSGRIAGHLVQRKCAACASGQGLCPNCAREEEGVQRKPLASTFTSLIQRQSSEEFEEEEETLRSKTASGQTPSVSSGVGSHIESLRGRGQPLPDATRAFFEPRFGQEFSQVRVHVDGKAAESAGAINALAYTVGRDVVFGEGQYQPHTDEGRRLLAHELSHTIQQGAAPRQRKQPQPASVDPGRVRTAQTHAIARKNGSAGGPSHKANDPNQLKSKLHPSGKAHLFADQVASIYFGTKSYVPDQDDHKVLKALAQEYQYTARRQGGLRGKVIGHADVRSSSAPDNQELSFQRARWTAATFKSYVTNAAGVKTANLQFETEGAGTDFCMGDPDCKKKVSPDALAQYRRADVMIFTEKMPSPKTTSCPPASGAGVTTVGEYIELIRCAEVTTGFTPRQMLALLRQMYYGKPWSATTQDPNWDFVIPCSPNLGNPKDKLGQNLFDALHNTVTIEGLDLGHVFAGLEAMTCPASSVTIEKSKFGVGIKLTVDLSNESFATWGGDVGSVAGAFVACWMMTDQERATKGKDECHQGRMPESLMQYFLRRQAPPEDLEGDIIPFAIRAAQSGACSGSQEQRFTPKAPISSAFSNFFYNRGPTGMTSRDRYRCFAEVIGATVVNGQITNRAALIQKYKPGVLSFAWAHYVNLKKEIPRSDPIVPLLERNSRAALHLFFDWLQARMQK